MNAVLNILIDSPVAGPLDFVLRVHHGSTVVQDSALTLTSGVPSTNTFSIPGVAPGQAGQVTVELYLVGVYEQSPGVFVTDPMVVSELVDFIPPAPSVPTVAATLSIDSA